MKLSEAIKTLDAVIPPPHDKMVDKEHMNITIAWREIKAILSVHENMLDIIAELFDEPCNWGNYDEYMSLNAGEWCEETCGNSQEQGAACWKKFLTLKIAEKEAAQQ